MRSRLISLAFPAAGLDRRWAYRAQPPFSSPDMLNVWPKDTLERRTRGGSRPGLRKWAYEQLGSGNPIRMLAGLHVVKSDGLTFWSDEFGGTALGSVWSVASWIGTLPVLFQDSASISFNGICGMVRSTLDAFNTSASGGYQVELFLTPYNGAYAGTYSIFARMNDTTPVATSDGIEVELTMTDALGTYGGQLRSYSAGVLTTYNFTGTGALGTPEPGWFKVLIVGDNVKAYWRGNLLIDQNVATHAGHRVGFGMNCTVAGGVALANIFRAQYYANDGRRVTKRMLLASSNGLLYKDTWLNSMGAVSSNLTLAADRPVMAQEHLQKLWIADRGDPKASGTDGVISSAKLDSASYVDWTTLGLDLYNYVVVITDVTGGSGSFANDIGGTFQISVIHATNGLTLLGASGGAATCTFRVERAPKVYDPATDALTLWADATGSQGAQVPTGCSIIALYLDRMVMAGDPQSPHAVYFSRQGINTANLDGAQDWDFGANADDVGRATALETSESGIPAEPVTALIPSTDDFLIVGCTNSVWILRGDPLYGSNKLNSLSRSVGIVSPSAWCRGPAGEIYFLGTNGLNVIPPGGGGIQKLSDKMPLELINLSASLYSVNMAYSLQDGGVHIHLSGMASARGENHWWYDLDTKGLYPYSLQATQEPLCCEAYNAPMASDSAVLLGGRDGYLRRFDSLAETDDGSSITSYVLYGPVRLGNDDYHDGMVMELVGILAKNSGPVTWSVHVAATHQDVKDAAAFSTGTWNLGGLNYKQRPRARGGSFALKLAGSGTRAWALEAMTAILATKGKQRLP